MKKYRIDIFKDNQHIKKYFDTLEEARANTEEKDNIFLLRLIGCIGKYEIIEQIR